MSERQPCPVCDGLPDSPCCNECGPIYARETCHHCAGAPFTVETLAIIGAWARARGWWRSDAQVETTTDGWTLWRDVSDTAYVMHGHGHTGWRVTPSVALLWAVLLEGEPLTVDVGRCRECRGSGVSWRLGVANDCDACPGPGRDIREAARLWLDTVERGWTPGFDSLRVAADQAQQAGDPRGEWLALALAGSDEWEAAARLALARAAHRRTTQTAAAAFAFAQPALITRPRALREHFGVMSRTTEPDEPR